LDTVNKESDNADFERTLFKPWIWNR
jgi:hypothetical protein